MTNGRNQPILTGMKVIDATQALAGPICTMYLGDMGAEVIKIEELGKGDMTRGWAPPYVGDESAYFLSTNRNKRGIALKLDTEEGSEILRKLVYGADIFLNNFPRLDSLTKRRLDPESCLQVNPGLIHVSLTGFGRTGPYAGRTGYDIIVQGMCGIMSITGEPEGAPVRYGVPIADLTGGIYAFTGILAAIISRFQTGKGQALDVSLLDSQLTWLSHVAGAYFATGQEAPRLGNQHATITPYQPFKARDTWFIIAVGSERLWQKMCKIIGVEESLMIDPRFATNPMRNVNRPLLTAQLEPIFLTRDAADWLAEFDAAGIPCGPIYSVPQALNDPHILARGDVVELDHPTAGKVKSLAYPVHFSGDQLSYRLPAPTLGQHTVEVLHELGYHDDDIQALRARGVI